MRKKACNFCLKGPSSMKKRKFDGNDAKKPKRVRFADEVKECKDPEANEDKYGKELDDFRQACEKAFEQMSSGRLANMEPVKKLFLNFVHSFKMLYWDKFDSDQLVADLPIWLPWVKPILDRLGQKPPEANYKSVQYCLKQTLRLPYGFLHGRLKADSLCYTRRSRQDLPALYRFEWNYNVT